jgi:hypothetical protein
MYVVNIIQGLAPATCSNWACFTASLSLAAALRLCPMSRRSVMMLCRLPFVSCACPPATAEC